MTIFLPGGILGLLRPAMGRLGLGPPRVAVRAG